MDTRRTLILGLCGLVIAVLATYSNSLSGEFFYDDSGAVVGNPYIKNIWPLGEAMSAPPRTTNSGRPVACLSLALNYQLCGYNVAGYRAVNVLLHLGCALLLFELVRRALLRRSYESQESAARMALVVAALWALHPLCSVLVNYVAQRCELLANFFILLTLYCAEKSFDSPRRALWMACACVACLLGVGSKEVAIVAPILVLLYERAFVRRSYAETLRASWPLYFSFCSAWVFAAWLIAQGGTANGARMGNLEWGPWAYLVAQSEAILLYVKLTVWPFALCFDYGFPARGLSVLWPAFTAVVLLGAAAVWAIVFRPALGFCLAWFFLLLAPSSSVMPLPDIAVEYRAVLAMAGLLAIGAFSVRRFFMRLGVMRAPMVLGGVLCGVLAIATFVRNRDYQSSLAIWADTIRKQPGNARGYANFGVAIAQRGDLKTAESALRKATMLNPNDAAVRMNFGAFLAMQGKAAEALPHFVRAAELSPGDAQHAFNLGNVYSDLKQSVQAVSAYRKAVELNPGFSDAYLNLGIELVGRKEFPAALQAFDQAAALDPQNSAVHLMRGQTLAAMGQVPAAREALERALALNPQNRAAMDELKRLSQ